MISLDNVSLLWFGRSPSLPPRCANESLRVFDERLTSLTNMDYLEAEDDRMYMNYWHYWKASELFSEDTTFGHLYYLLFTFTLFLLSPILRHQSAFYYFIISEVDSQNRIMVLPGGYIFLQSQLLLMKHRNILFVNFFNKDNGLVPHNIIRCSSEDNVCWWLWAILWLEENHMVIGPDLFYLNRYNCVSWYIVDFFSLGSKIYLV